MKKIILVLLVIISLMIVSGAIKVSLENTNLNADKFPEDKLESCQARNQILLAGIDDLKKKLNLSEALR